jgi:hypothetical protein
MTVLVFAFVVLCCSSSWAVSCTISSSKSDTPGRQAKTPIDRERPPTRKPRVAWMSLVLAYRGAR